MAPHLYAELQVDNCRGPRGLGQNVTVTDLFRVAAVHTELKCVQVIGGILCVGSPRDNREQYEEHRSMISRHRYLYHCDIALTVTWDGRLIFHLQNRAGRHQVHGLVLALFRARAQHRGARNRSPRHILPTTH